MNHYNDGLYPSTMKTFAIAIAEARQLAGLNQSELARRIGVTPQSVQAWESGRAEPRPKLLPKIAEATGVPLAVLMEISVQEEVPDTFRTYISDARKRNTQPVIQEIEPWDDETPLDEDEVYVPFLKEVELSAGSGRTSVELSTKRKLRFGKITLRNQGVQFDKAVALTVHGNSMAPMLPDGSTVGIDTASTIVRDGKTYAINQGGQLRVKTLHRLPGGGVRMRSFNRDEYPDEDYSLEDMAEQNIVILGRVFWSSVLW